jgi:ABC-type amino acid transport substrate-binding protein
MNVPKPAVKVFPKLLIALIFILAASQSSAEHDHDSGASLTDAQVHYLRDNQTLSLCPIPGFIPLEWVTKQGKHEGLFSDLLTIVASKAGLQFKPYPAENYVQSLKSLEQGQCDLLTRVMADAGGREGDTSQPFFTAELGYVIAVENDTLLPSTSMVDRRLGVVTGHDSSELRQRNPSVELFEFESMHAGVEAVIASEIDAMVAPLVVLREYVKHHDSAYIKVGGALGIHQDFAWQVSEQHVPLLPILNKTIASISEDERQHFIHHRLHRDVAQHIDNYYIAGMILVILLLLILLYRYRHLWQRSLQLEHTLEDSEKRFQRLADNAPTCCFV